MSEPQEWPEDLAPPRARITSSVVVYRVTDPAGTLPAVEIPMLSPALWCPPPSDDDDPEGQEA